MHEELSPEAAERYPLAEFTDDYGRAQEMATVASVTPASVRGRDRGPAGGGRPGQAEHPRLRPDSAAGSCCRSTDDEMAWSPNLVFPGLGPGERLVRRARVPEARPDPGRDGTPLAEGPACADPRRWARPPQSVAGRSRRPPPSGTGERCPARVPARHADRDQRPRARLRPRARRTARAGSCSRSAARRATRRDGARLKASPCRASPFTPPSTRASSRPRWPRSAASFGGVAVLDARNGSVLALAGIAFSAPQPPGSTFKVITTTAALEAGVVELTDQFPVQTSATVGGREVANANNEACGGSFVEAFAQSCNSVFVAARPQDRLGAPGRSGGALRLQLSPRACSTPGGHRGREPAPEHHPPVDPRRPRPRGERDRPGPGAGDAAARWPRWPRRSPTAVSAEPTGDRQRPQAGARGEARAGHARRRWRRPCASLMIAWSTAGTGTAAALPGVQVAGKTGTAELGPKPLEPGKEPRPGRSPSRRSTPGSPGSRPPSDPKLVAAAMVVDAHGDGGTMAAPIVREVLAAGLGAVRCQARFRRPPRSTTGSRA